MLRVLQPTCRNPAPVLRSRFGSDRRSPCIAGDQQDALPDRSLAEGPRVTSMPQPWETRHAALRLHPAHDVPVLAIRSSVWNSMTAMGASCRLAHRMSNIAAIRYHNTVISLGGRAFCTLTKSVTANTLKQQRQAAVDSVKCDLIRRAAKKLFAERGLDATTVREIA